MRFEAIVLCFFLLPACDHSPEPHAAEGALSAAQPAPTPSATLTPSATPEKSADSAKQQATQPKPSECVVPLAAEPARRVPKALHCPADPEKPPELGHGYVVFNDAPGTPRLNVELAQSEPEKERGLMFRTKMPDDQGMLFSWEKDEPRTFWMHNTCIPLDMMFITGDGLIAGILEQVPTLNDEPRGVPCPVAYVLEVNAGWSRAHGIKPGTIVHFE